MKLKLKEIFFNFSNIQSKYKVFTYLNWFLSIQTMQEMNKVMDPQKTAKMMQEFERENMKMGMTEEMSKLMLVLNGTHDNTRNK